MQQLVLLLSRVQGNFFITSVTEYNGKEPLAASSLSTKHSVLYALMSLLRVSQRQGDVRLYAGNTREVRHAAELEAG